MFPWLLFFHHGEHAIFNKRSRIIFWFIIKINSILMIIFQTLLYSVKHSQYSWTKVWNQNYVFEKNLPLNKNFATVSMPPKWSCFSLTHLLLWTFRTLDVRRSQNVESHAGHSVAHSKGDCFSSSQYWHFKNYLLFTIHYLQFPGFLNLPQQLRRLLSYNRCSFSHSNIFLLYSCTLFSWQKHHWRFGLFVL